MKRKANPEFVSNIRVFYRAKDNAAAAEFQAKLRALIEDQVDGNWLEYRVSLTGTGADLPEYL